jgi:hypothetical protein
MLGRKARHSPSVPVELEHVLSAQPPVEDRLHVAWKWVEQEREWYARHGARSRNVLSAAQIVAMFLSGVTPVLVAWTELSPVLQALPAALAAIVLGASTGFGWRETWVRFMQTAAELEREQLRFVTRTRPYDTIRDQEELVRALVENASRIVSGEYESWGRAAARHRSD